MKRILALTALLQLLLLACAGRREVGEVTLEMPEPIGSDIEPQGGPEMPPTVRIKLGEGSFFRVEIEDSFTLYRMGRAIGKGSDVTLDLRLRSASAAVVVYYALISEEDTRSRAVLRADSLVGAGLPAVVRAAGRVYHLGPSEIDNRKYLVLVGPYDTESEAHRVPGIGQNGIVRSMVRLPSGVCEIGHGRGEKSVALDLPIRIVPRGPSEFPLSVVDHWTGERKSYGGVLDLRISSGGSMLLINELPLEEYLRGVLPHEMGPGFPLEALKAQAVAARSFTLAYLDLKPSLFHEPYDFTADVSSQVYGGMKMGSTRTDSAISLTGGQILVRDGGIVRGFYHSCSGGHTESSDIITGDSCGFLEGVSDLVEGETPDLRTEAGVRAFLDGHPNAYSGYSGFPSHLYWLERGYRWQVTCTADEIEAAVALRTGSRIGDLIGLTPLRRGVSGRISRLEVRGTKQTIVLRDQLEIRQAMSKKPLRSSLFYVRARPGPDGRPDQITFVGGGFGHGVGMCQTGATARALLGEDYREILLHYYRGCSIVDLY